MIAKKKAKTKTVKKVNAVQKTPLIELRVPLKREGGCFQRNRMYFASKEKMARFFVIPAGAKGIEFIISNKKTKEAHATKVERYAVNDIDVIIRVTRFVVRSEPTRKFITKCNLLKSFQRISGFWVTVEYED